MGAAKPSRRRADVAADLIAAAARQVPAGTRLGSREELRAMCDVSVGTLHEALRLLQATGEIVVRPGPGGGAFAGEKSALSGMLRDVHQLDPGEADFAQAARVLNALAPLVMEDAVAFIDEVGTQRVREALAALEDAREADLRTFVRASLEVFATVVSLGPTGVLTVMAGSLLRTQVAALHDVVDEVDPAWRDVVDRHAVAVGRLVDAIEAGDAARALATCRNPEFMGLFVALALARR